MSSEDLETPPVEEGKFHQALASQRQDLRKEHAVTTGIPSSWKVPVIIVGVMSLISLILSISLPLALQNDGSSESKSLSSGAYAVVTSLGDATRLGVLTFVTEADLLCSKIDLLASVIGMGDLEEAKKVYAISRSFYEQIEVLAESFETIDCNIDCRPYSFEYGDADPRYFGFHRIESHLFRDANTSLALPFAQALQGECASLQDALKGVADTPTELSPVPTWEGMLGLAKEIAAKKISGEEEAYSGLSLLIFHENYRGILSQYMPFHNLVVAKDISIAMEVTQAIDEALIHLQGYYNSNAEYGMWTDYRTLDSYRRKIIYDNSMRVVRALTAALNVLDVDLPAEGGAESSSDDGGDVSAAVVPPTGFETEVAACVDHFQSLVAKMVTSVDALAAAITSGDLGASRLAYETSRLEYEQIEVLALFFPLLDRDIDARPYTFEFGEDDPEFKGFHKIERALFRDGNMDVAMEYTMRLVNSTRQLATVAQNVTGFHVTGIFEGMIELAVEIASKKISGEEETFSDLSILIFEQNWQGIAAMYAPFAARPEINDTAIGSAVWELFGEQKEMLAIIKNESFPVAFAGSTIPSYRSLPSDTFVERIAATSYHLANSLVEVADTLGDRKSVV